MIDLIIAALLAATLFQRDQYRFAAAGIYSFAIVAHGAVFENLSNDYYHYYYVSAALGDMIVISIFVRLQKVTGLAVSLAKLSILSIVLNTYGFVEYMLYRSPALYNFCYLVLYSYAIIIIMRGDKTHVGVDDVGNMWRKLYRNYFSSMVSVSDTKRKK